MMRPLKLSLSLAALLALGNASFAAPPMGPADPDNWRNKDLPILARKRVPPIARAVCLNKPAFSTCSYSVPHQDRVLGECYVLPDSEFACQAPRL